MAVDGCQFPREPDVASPDVHMEKKSPPNLMKSLDLSFIVKKFKQLCRTNLESKGGVTMCHNKNNCECTYCVFSCSQKRLLTPSIVELSCAHNLPCRLDSKLPEDGAGLALLRPLCCRCSGNSSWSAGVLLSQVFGPITPARCGTSRGSKSNMGSS